MASGRSDATIRGIGLLLASGSTAGLSDGQVLERFASRDDPASDAAFETLVARHGPMVLGVCRRLMRDEHAADDVFQAVFLVLARRARSIREPDLLGPWLYGVTLRTVREARSREAKRQGRESPLGEEILSSTEAVDHPALRREEAEALHDEVRRLPEKYRRAVVLCHFEGLTHEEAAHRLGTPVGTVGVRLMRARERLRGRLERRGVGAAPVAAFLLRPTLPSLPASLATATVRGAISFTQKHAAVAGTVSASAATLAEGVLRTMIPNVPKIVAAGLVLLVLAGTAWAIAPARPRGQEPVGKAAAPRVQTPEEVEIAAKRKWRTVYGLGPDQVVKRVAPPFIPERMVDAEARFPFLKQNRERRGFLLTLTYHQKGGTLQNPMVSFSGSPDTKGRWLIYLITELAGIDERHVEGPKELLETEISGDFLVRDEASKAEIVAALERILWLECEQKIKLSIREVERDVVVVRGKYTFKPRVEGRNVIDLYGETIDDGRGGGTGDFAQFLNAAGEFLEPSRLFINEAEDAPKGEISWQLNARNPPTANSKDRTDHDAKLVLKHLEEQTGLTFTPERRKVRIVFVEAAK